MPNEKIVGLAMELESILGIDLDLAIDAVEAILREHYTPGMALYRTIYAGDWTELPAAEQAQWTRTALRIIRLAT